MISIATNLLILVLLAGVTVYASLLSRRVNRLMAALAELGPLVRDFSQAVDKSEQSVAELKGAAADAARRDADHAAARAAARAAEEAAALQEATQPISFASVRHRPVAGMTRVGGKSDLVKSFFERGRGRAEAAGQW